MIGIILAVLRRLWMVLSSCFSGPEPPSMLPVSVRPPENSTEGSSRGVGRKGGEGFVNTEQIWNAQFLRHPSLRSNDREHDSENEDVSKNRAKNRDFKLPTVIVQDWSSLISAANVKPPPRPSSGKIPSVIITPCTPTDNEGITSTMEEFPFNSAISSPLDAIAALTLLVEPPTLRDSNKKRLIAYGGDSKPGSDPPFPERDIDNLQKRDNPFSAPSHLSVYSPQTSLVSSESLAKISYDPLPNSHSTAPDTPADTSWSPSPPNDSFRRTFPYTTSTPVKRRRLSLSDSELVFETDSLESYSSEPPHALRLPEALIDLLPYPDVFDLDMYFGPESSRSTPLPQYRSSPSIIRVPIEDRNPFLVSNATAIGADDNPRKVAKRFAFIPDVPANSAPGSPPTTRETRRHRDLYRHHAYSRSPQVAIEDTTLDSVVSITPPRLISPPRMVGPSRPALRRELNQNKMTRFSPQQGLSSLAHRVKFSEYGRYPSPSAASEKVTLPIVIVSHYRSPSSTLSDDSSLSESV